MRELEIRRLEENSERDIQYQLELIRLQAQKEREQRKARALQDHNMIEQELA